MYYDLFNYYPPLIYYMVICFVLQNCISKNNLNFIVNWMVTQRVCRKVLMHRTQFDVVEWPSLRHKYLVGNKTFGKKITRTNMSVQYVRVFVFVVYCTRTYKCYREENQGCSRRRTSTVSNRIIWFTSNWEKREGLGSGKTKEYTLLKVGIFLLNVNQLLSKTITDPKILRKLKTNLIKKGKIKKENPRLVLTSAVTYKTGPVVETTYDYCFLHSLLR